MEKVRKSSVRQEAVEDTVEVTPEEKSIRISKETASL
mgnify:CR=1 FL=1